MKLFAPVYYSKFKCIADKCRHSCCVGWEIDVDGEALEKYEALPEQPRKKILDTVEMSDGVAHFRLDEKERCPHLSERGLCNIITRHGEGFLCEICREHPRFYNLLGNRAEVGIGAVCEVAAELILGCKDYCKIEIAGELDGRFEDGALGSLAEREELYRILSDTESSYSDRLLKIREKYSLETVSELEMKSILSELEYLNPSDKEIFLAALPRAAGAENEKYCERALAYFIYRYVSPCETEEERKSALSLCLFLERLFSSLLEMQEKSDTDTAVLLFRMLSEEIEYSEENIEQIKLNLI
jgi:lysine-N-methylase